MHTTYFLKAFTNVFVYCFLLFLIFNVLLVNNNLRYKQDIKLKTLMI